jgi:hypothetical protein
LHPSVIRQSRSHGGTSSKSKSSRLRQKIRTGRDAFTRTKRTATVKVGPPPVAIGAAPANCFQLPLLNPTAGYSRRDKTKHKRSNGCSDMHHEIGSGRKYFDPIHCRIRPVLHFSALTGQPDTDGRGAWRPELHAGFTSGGAVQRRRPVDG